MADRSMTAVELLEKLTELPRDRIIPALGRSLQMYQDEDLFEVATRLIEHKIAEGIAVTAMNEKGEETGEVEFFCITYAFMKVAKVLNKNPDWDVVHIHVESREGSPQAYLLVTKPVEKGEDGDEAS